MDEYMSAAIEQAMIGLNEGGIPIGSVLVKNNKIVSRGYNKRVQLNNQILHGEMDCLFHAGRIKNFKDTILYTTCMPCYMCAGTIVQFKIPKVVVGESKNFPGAIDFLIQHGVEVVDMKIDECEKILGYFIKNNPEVWNEDIGE